MGSCRGHGSDDIMQHDRPAATTFQDLEAGSCGTRLQFDTQCRRRRFVPCSWRAKCNGPAVAFFRRQLQTPVGLICEPMGCFPETATGIPPFDPGRDWSPWQPSLPDAPPAVDRDDDDD